MDFNITFPLDDIRLPSFIPPGNYKYVLKLTKKIDDKFLRIFQSVATIKIVKI